MMGRLRKNGGKRIIRQIRESKNNSALSALFREINRGRVKDLHGQ